MVAAYDPLNGMIDLPSPPEVPAPVKLPTLTLTDTVSFSEMVDMVDASIRETHPKTKSMEELELHDGNGQSYGYIVYRKWLTLKPGSRLTVRGHIRDLLQVMVDGRMVSEPVYSSTH